MADLAERGIRPAGCLIGEPTDMQAIVAHKGKRDCCCRVRGREAHSSLTPAGVNAIEFAARLVTFIRDLADRLARDEPRDARFAVPYTTLQTGVIRGGIAVNVVPRDCEFTFEMRKLPATSTDELTHEIVEYARTRVAAKMKGVTAAAAIDVRARHGLPAFGIAADDPLVRWAQELARTHAPGRRCSRVSPPRPACSRRPGIPTVVIGPGSIEQAHKPNEYITLEQVAACEQFFERLIASRPPRR